MTSLPDNTTSASSQQPQRSQVFISYSRKDKRYLDELHTQLSLYVRSGYINYWDDTKIRPGAHWREELDQALNSARVAVLLVSSDFLASNFIIEQELPPLLAAEKRQETKIISVILDYCAYKLTELANIQTMNDPAQPLGSISKLQRKQVWLKVAEEVKNNLGSV